MTTGVIAEAAGLFSRYAPTCSPPNPPASRTVTAPSLIARACPAVRIAQPVERPLGPQFLRRPDAGVDHQHHPEQRVLRWPDDQDHDEQRPGSR
jgi:hypothetical protein